jgi:hypothetical protein
MEPISWFLFHTLRPQASSRLAPCCSASLTSPGRSEPVGCWVAAAGFAALMSLRRGEAMSLPQYTSGT